MSLLRGDTRNRSSSLERKRVYASPSVYYNNDESWKRQLLGSSNRTIASYIKAPSRTRTRDDLFIGSNYPQRRISHDETGEQRQEFVVDVEETLKILERREDLDGNKQITIDDNGPKHIALGTLASAGYKTKDVRGNYVISNLYQELTLAKELGKSQIKIDKERLQENPCDRLYRRIRDEFWKNLERRLDASAIEVAGKDPKDWTDDPRPRIYIPRACPEQHDYYTEAAKTNPDMRLDVQWLEEDSLTPDYIRDLNEKPGILALAMKTVTVDGKETLQGEPFVVPGGRFNELYGWDSYMVSIGLLINGRIDLAESMVRNFVFCIQHYGKILNANRSYYLMRSQPPLLTDMALKVFDKIGYKDMSYAKDFLRLATLAAIKEYYSVWMSEPRHDSITGLSRYRTNGRGIPPETEASHFLHILTPYAKKHNLEFKEFVKAYNMGEIEEPELDEYFLHDRGVRESGHDTSYRLEGVAADLATVDLNSLLYKYETDIAFIIKSIFNDRLIIPAEWQTKENHIDQIERSATWDRRSQLRKRRIDKYMWNDKKGMYFDYDTIKKQQIDYESATTFWTMWAKVASPRQAAMLMIKALPLFEVFGGLVSGTKESRGDVGLDRPNRQWDYPFGWAPQQMLAWGGFSNYGYDDELERICYKWLYMVLKAFFDFNGVVVEKYNVTRELDPHRVEAEYGNQGADFKGVPKEGFGWVNASFVYGMEFMNVHMTRALQNLTPWETYAKSKERRLELGLSDMSIDEVSEESSRAGSTASEEKLPLK